MAVAPNGTWQPWDLDGPGRHTCNGARSDVETAPARGLFTRNQPLTHPIECWWCGDAVFFHTNGHRDMVLFNELGWPWQVHGCWLEHVDERDERVRAMEHALRQDGFDGLRNTSPRAASQKPAAGKAIRFSGFVSDHEHGREGRPHYRLGEESDEALWTTLKVTTSAGTCVRVLAPENVVATLPRYALVGATGRWHCGRKTWHFVCTSLEEYVYSSGHDSKRQILWRTSEHDGPVRLRRVRRQPSALGSRLRIKLASHDHKLLDLSMARIVRTARSFHCATHGPIPLPTVKTQTSEGLTTIKHRRRIDLLDPPQNLLASFSSLDLPTGVDIAMKIL